MYFSELTIEELREEKKLHEKGTPEYKALNKQIKELKNG